MIAPDLNERGIKALVNLKMMRRETLNDKSLDDPNKGSRPDITREGQPREGC
jgi:hypothetical protein